MYNNNNIIKNLNKYNNNLKKFYNQNEILFINLPKKYQNMYNDYLKGNNNAESDRYIYNLINGYNKVNKKINFLNKTNKKNNQYKCNKSNEYCLLQKKDITKNQFYCCICMNLNHNKKTIFFNCEHYCCLGCFIKLNNCHLCGNNLNENNKYFYPPKILFYNYTKFFYKSLIKKFGIKVILIYYFLKKNKNKKILILNNYDTFNHNLLSFNKIFYELDNFHILVDNDIYKFNPENIAFNYDLILICDITYNINVIRINFLNEIRKIKQNNNCTINQIIIKNTIEDKISKNLITFI